MAKIFKITTYIVDSMDEYDVFSVEDLLQYCCQNDVELRATNIQEKDIGEWDDDCEVNKIVCPNSVFEEYFK